MSAEILFECPAIRVKQRIGLFWVASVPASVLLACTVPDPLRIVVDPKYEGSDEWTRLVRLLGNQRDLRMDRLKEIAKYVDGVDSTFPNSVILAVPTPDDDSAAAWGIEESSGGCAKMTIPKGCVKASVVDGQHRLYSFLHTQVKDRQDFELVCALFFDIPSSVQAYIFATINTNQKPVRRGMALNLHGYNVEDEPREVWSPEKLAVFLARRLNWDPDSPLHSRIKIEAGGAPVPMLLPGARKAIPLAALVDGILKQIAIDPKSDRDALRSERVWSRTKRRKLKDDGSPLRDWYLKSEDGKIYDLLLRFVSIVDSTVWQVAGDRSMLTRAVGVRALFDFLAGGLKRTPQLWQQWSGGDPLASVFGGPLSQAARLNFAHPIFEASSRGQRRILQTLLLVAKWISLADIPEHERSDIVDVIGAPARKP